MNPNLYCPDYKINLNQSIELMNKELQFIREKIGNIQFGILRCKDHDVQRSWQVKAAPDEDNVLHCIVTGDMTGDDIIDKQVNLIQKYHNDYLYITGTVSAEAKKKVQVLSINIAKACWFVRRSKGATSWLQQKYIYENYMPEQLEIAS